MITGWERIDPYAVLAGKSRDGYFTNNKILRHAGTAMAILQKHYPNEDHVFVFDNALSACNMPKSCRQWGVDTSVKDARGKAIIAPYGQVVTKKVHMSDGFFNGAPQEFYWPEGHENTGKFKRMIQILEERGFEAKKLQCNKDFRCIPGSTNCCCHCILYNQPDFINVDSLLETTSSSKEADLEANMIKALDSVPLESMQKFAM
ncbi:hypothetical protein BS17DRAFT_770649 [Gyrodon lividus]|nr:hypothetical protein BS17DRAFT_770649 [Gyrodon lividus]